MRALIRIVCMSVSIVLMAAGCASPSRDIGAQGSGPTRTDVPNAEPTIALQATAPIPSTQTSAGSTTGTSVPPQAYDYSSRDYGFGANDNSSGDGGATPTTVSGGTSADQTNVAVAETALGPILVDGQGHTLYALTMDAPGVSTCTGNCLEAWPPLLTTGGPVAGGGVQAALLGSFARSDGGMQVTYDGKPLYTYSQDAAPGDLKGQGKGGVWFAVTALGDYAR
jgi:predicted lipoprotein with Yx(FWY)xxD motif